MLRTTRFIKTSRAMRPISVKTALRSRRTLDGNYSGPRLTFGGEVGGRGSEQFNNWTVQKRAVLPF